MLWTLAKVLVFELQVAASTFSDGYIGCYGTPEQKATKQISNNSGTACKRFCFQESNTSFQYAGTSYMGCFCLNALPNGEPVSDTKCGTTCLDQTVPDEKCGGINLISVFNAQITSTASTTTTTTTAAVTTAVPEETTSYNESSTAKGNFSRDESTNSNIHNILDTDSFVSSSVINIYAAAIAGAFGASVCLVTSVVLIVRRLKRTDKADISPMSTNRPVPNTSDVELSGNDVHPDMYDVIQSEYDVASEHRRPICPTSMSDYSHHNTSGAMFRDQTYASAKYDPCIAYSYVRKSCSEGYDHQQVRKQHQNYTNTTDNCYDSVCMNNDEMNLYDNDDVLSVSSIYNNVFVRK